MRSFLLAACCGLLFGCGSSESRDDGIATPEIPISARQRTPEAVAARAKEIRATVDAIRAERPNGDWDAWLAETAKYRQALKHRLDTLQDISDEPEGPQSGRFARATPHPHHYVPYEALESIDGFPLFHVAAREWVPFLCNDRCYEKLQKDRTLKAATLWLRQRGIDVIFVPVPVMTEVYIEHFISPTPEDGIIAPHARRVIKECCEDDVEVVDGFRILSPEKQKAYLYRPADIHWAQPGQRLMATEVARRLERYRLTKNVELKPAERPSPEQCGLNTLRKDQREIVLRSLAPTFMQPTMPDGADVPDDPASPVMLIGNSFSRFFREELVAKIGCKIRTHCEAGQSTEAFGDFLRDPQMLNGVQVVVWISTERDMSMLRPMPSPILASLNE